MLNTTEILNNLELIEQQVKMVQENTLLKSTLNKSNKVLYNLIQGLRKMEEFTSADDYYFEIERLLTGEVEVWHEANKIIQEEERLRLIRLNGLSKLSEEEKQALGLI